MDIFSPALYTLTRGSVAGLLNNLGQFESFAINTLLARHYPLGYAGALPAALAPKVTMLQRACTNKLTTPEGPYSGGNWSITGATVPSTNNPSSRQGDLTANFVREDTSTGVHGLFQSFTIGAA